MACPTKLALRFRKTCLPKHISPVLSVQVHQLLNGGLLRRARRPLVLQLPFPLEVIGLVPTVWLICRTLKTLVPSLKC